MMNIPDRQDDWQTDELASLCRAILTLTNEEEVARFLRDLCTFREIAEMSSRWSVVKLLDTGIPYRQIAEESGMSTATITRVNQWLRHGSGGYRMAADRTKEQS